MELYSELTEGYLYTLGFVAMSPFLSRERFWYYLLSIEFANYVKVNLKMVQSEPRPNWEWNDLGVLGCSSSFGSPSGHSTRSAHLAFLLVLDHFFASQWSRIKYPNLNKMSVSTHKLTFGVATVVAMTFWLLSLFDRMFLGKHTLNQVILGSQLGIWCAFFSHFVLRDSIFSHFTRITSKAG
jgi:acid phosphatase family membrane protein YuiD